MSHRPVTMVRVYLNEGSGLLKGLLAYLHDESGVAGVTVFRGIAGFGHSHKMHTATLVDLSLDLPVVIEFFEAPERAGPVIEHLGEVLGPERVVHWSARVNA